MAKDQMDTIVTGFIALFSDESPVGVGIFLEENSGLFSVLVLFSVAGAALPEFLSTDSREFALGVLGLFLILVVVVSVLLFRLALQIVHAYVENRFIRLTQHLTLFMGLVLFSSSLGYAVQQYQNTLYTYIDLLIFGIPCMHSYPRFSG